MGDPPLRIAVDAMGGDHAPAAVVAGSVAAARDLGVTVLLVGPEGRIRQELRRHRPLPEFVRVVDAAEVIEMHESPAMALRRKKQASIIVAMEQVRDGAADAVVSAGHTGAAMGAALLRLGCIPGIDRPAIATILPTTARHPVVMLDVGANVDCKPHHLQQFAVMGSVYANRVLGIGTPRIGVLSNGAEEGKGSDLVLRAAALLRQTPGIQFVGNVEGRDVFGSLADVVVCDGFVGNVALKLAEGMAITIRDVVQNQMRGWGGQLIRLYLAPLAGRIRALYRRFDYHEYGGAPLLGIEGVCVIAHGSSNARAIRNAIRAAADAVAHGFVDGMRAVILPAAQAGSAAWRGAPPDVPAGAEPAGATADAAGGVPRPPGGIA